MPNVITSVNDARAIEGAIATWIHVNGSLVKDAFGQEGTVASNMMFTLDRIVGALETRPTYAPAISFWLPTGTVLPVGIAINEHAPCVCAEHDGWDRCLYPRWVEFIECYRDEDEDGDLIATDPAAYEDAIIVLPTMRNDEEEED